MVHGSWFIAESFSPGSFTILKKFAGKKGRTGREGKAFLPYAICYQLLINTENAKFFAKNTMDY